MGHSHRASEATGSNGPFDALRDKLATLDRELAEAERGEADRLAEAHAQLAEAREKQARAERKVEAMKGLVSEA